MNDIEARRVRNALKRVADAAPALPPEELAAMAVIARSAPVATERRRLPWPAVAAATALAAAVGIGAIAFYEGERRSATTAGSTLVTFPEGSAVHLLTATAERDRGR
jgi:hypothetical protein